MITGDHASTASAIVRDLGIGSSDDRAFDRAEGINSRLLWERGFFVANARSEYRSVFRISPVSNRYLLAAMVLAFAVHVGALSFGPAQFVVWVEPISMDA